MDTLDGARADKTGTGFPSVRPYIPIHRDRTISIPPAPGHSWPHLKQGASIVSIMAAFLTSSASSDRSSVHCSCRSAVLVAVNQSHGRGVGVNAYLSITINHGMPLTSCLALVPLLLPPMGPQCSQDGSSSGMYDHWLIALARRNSNLAHTLLTPEEANPQFGIER